MKKNLFEGNIVRLRAIEERDWKNFHEMALDSHTQRCAGEIGFPGSTKAEQESAKTESLKGAENDVFRFAIEHIDKAELAGVINTHSIDRKNGTFEYGLGVHPYYRRQGCASEAILLLLNFFFKELRYQKCTAAAYSFNPASYHLHVNLGFKVEGQLRNMVFSNGKYHDLLMFGITNDEFLTLHGDKCRTNLPHSGGKYEQESI